MQIEPKTCGLGDHDIEQHAPLQLKSTVYEALHVDEFDSNNKSSSLVFSFCCRPLGGPVLDVLRKYQTDLVTLFKVLPPDLWELKGTVTLVSTG